MFYVVKKYGFKKARVFFTIDEEFKRQKNMFFIVEYNYINEETFDNEITLSVLKSQTLLSNIEKSDEEIMMDFTSNTKYKVKRAIREGGTSKFYYSKNGKTDVLKKLIQDVDIKLSEMYVTKGIDYSSISNLLLEYLDKEILAISVGISDSKEVAYHVYVMADSICRLAYSVSAFRDENDERNKIAMVNRMLHYDDMRHARELGFTTYDWGGYGQDEAVLNISKFKEGFGGKVANYVIKNVVKKSIIGLLYSFYLKLR